MSAKTYREDFDTAHAELKKLFETVTAQHDHVVYELKNQIEFLTDENKVLQIKAECKEESSLFFLKKCDQLESQLESYKKDFEFLKEQYEKIPAWIKRKYNAEELVSEEI